MLGDVSFGGAGGEGTSDKRNAEGKRLAGSGGGSADDVAPLEEVGSVGPG